MVARPAATSVVGTVSTGGAGDSATVVDGGVAISAVVLNGAGRNRRPTVAAPPTAAAANSMRVVISNTRGWRGSLHRPDRGISSKAVRQPGDVRPASALPVERRTRATIVGSSASVGAKAASSRSSSKPASKSVAPMSVATVSDTARAGIVAASGSAAATNASAVGHRERGSLCRARSIAAARLGGTSMSKESSGGRDSCFCLYITSYSESPGHGRSPVSN